MLEAAGLADKLAHLPRRNKEAAYYHTMCKRSNEYVSEKMFGLRMKQKRRIVSFLRRLWLVIAWMILKPPSV